MSEENNVVKGALLVMTVCFLVVCAMGIFLGIHGDKTLDALDACLSANTPPKVHDIQAFLIKDCVFSEPCQFVSIYTYQKKVRSMASLTRSLRRLHDA